MGVFLDLELIFILCIDNRLHFQTLGKLSEFISSVFRFPKVYFYRIQTFYFLLIFNNQEDKLHNSVFIHFRNQPLILRYNRQLSFSM